MNSWPHHGVPPSCCPAAFEAPSLAGSAPRGDSVTAVTLPWSAVSHPGESASLLRLQGGPCSPASPACLPAQAHPPRHTAPPALPLRLLPRYHLRRGPGPPERSPLHSTPAFVSPLHPSLPDGDIRLFASFTCVPGFGGNSAVQYKCNMSLICHRPVNSRHTSKGRRKQ